MKIKERKQSEDLRSFDSLLVDYTEKYSDLVSFWNSNRYHPTHRWYSFVEGYSSEFVRRIIGEQERMPRTCIDPFSGTGTTLLTCQNLGVKCYGYEVNPFFVDIARAKLGVNYNVDKFRQLLDSMRSFLKQRKKSPILPRLESETFFQSPKLDKWIFDSEVAKGIGDILEFTSLLEKDNQNYEGLFRLALASILPGISNVFRNGKCLSYKKNWREINISRSEVHSRFLSQCQEVILPDIQSTSLIKPPVLNYPYLCHGDTREGLFTVPDDAIDLAIFSPPYLNSRDYTDVYRLELWILGYVSTFKQERRLRKESLTSHVQIKLPEFDTPEFHPLRQYVDYLVNLNGKLWNKNIPNMVKGYFFDMEKVLNEVYSKLKKGGKAYVNVSNSAYAGRVCEVDFLLALIGEKIGFRVKEIRLARMLKSSSQQKLGNGLRESVIVFEKI